MILIKRYRFFIGAVIVLAALFFINNQIAMKTIDLTIYQLKTMALVIPPIFILLGLLDIWVPRETMVKYMGEGSGIKGTVLAIFLGSAAAGPLYGAFPVAAVFMKKGASFKNILVFIGAWSTTKIPMFLFEMSALGAKFALTRLFINIPGIIIIAMILNKLISKEEIKSIYKKAETYAS